MQCCNGSFSDQTLHAYLPDEEKACVISRMSQQNAVFRSRTELPRPAQYANRRWVFVTA